MNTAILIILLIVGPVLAYGGVLLMGAGFVKGGMSLGSEGGKTFVVGAAMFGVGVITAIYSIAQLALEVTK